jgi:HK97 family phage major capsid protein
MTLEQKIALLKKAGIEVGDDASEKEVDELIEEKTEEFDENEEAEKSIKEVSVGGLKSIVNKVVSENMKSIEENISAKVANLKSEVNAEEKGIKESADFVKALCLGTKVINGTVGSFGYAVPTTLANKIQEGLDKEALMRKYCFVFKMAGNYQLPQEGTGVTSYWVAQNDLITESSPTLGKTDLVDLYLATRVLIPRGLLNSSPLNLTNYITNLCVRSITNEEETAFIAGAGTTEPTGLRSAGVDSIAQDSTGLVYKDIIDLMYSLERQYRKNAVFLTSTAGVKALMNIQDENKRPIFDPTNNTVLGKPLLETEDIPSNLGSSTNLTEIYFGDMSYYFIKDGEEMFMESVKIPSRLQTEIVIAKAVDGVYTLPEAMKKLTAVLSA